MGNEFMIEVTLDAGDLKHGQWLRDWQRKEKWSDAETINIAAQMIDQLDRVIRKLPEIVLSSFLKDQTLKRVYFERDESGDMRSPLTILEKRF
jgi:hypothetical protein